jgi:hypothetical protein
MCSLPNPADVTLLLRNNVRYTIVGRDSRLELDGEKSHDQCSYVIYLATSISHRIMSKPQDYR